jgi:hypothetical protein
MEVNAPLRRIMSASQHESRIFCVNKYFQEELKQETLKPSPRNDDARNRQPCTSGQANDHRHIPKWTMAVKPWDIEVVQSLIEPPIAGNDVPFDQVQKAWRNMIASVTPVSPVYGWLYQAVRESNLERHGKHQIRLLMGSPPGDWDKIKTAQDLAPFEAEREQWYMHVVKDEVLARHHHALLRHRQLKEV